MNKHVDFSDEDIVIVRHDQLGLFIEQAVSNTDNLKYRYCLHDTPDNKLQEMFIVRKRGEYWRPDRHDKIPETHMIMRGEEAVILFDEKGRILNIIFLNEKEDVLAYRISSRIFHMTVALSDWAIDYEVKPGPFAREMNEFPDWAPAYDEQDKIEKFMHYITGEIERWKNEQ